VRLAALLEAPHAFGSTWEREKDRSEDQWRNAVVSRTRFVAESDGEAIGTASIGEAGPGRAGSVTSFWVHPRARGKGVGDALVLATVESARAAGYDELLLWVVENNDHAQRLYERHGFQRTGATQLVRPGDDRLECEMSKSL
jgi:ribosomal protein S18 acetylase RimI-like enzyme